MTRHLCMITLGDYAQHPPIRGAAADAERLRVVLEDSYGYSSRATPELRDAAATNAAIRERFEALQKLPASDDLIIVFNGHGNTDTDGIGAWLPYDAGADPIAGTNFIQNQRIRSWLSKVPCRHVLVIANCCFSGDLLDEYRNLVVDRDAGFLATAPRFESREVLTSGGSELVQAAGVGEESAFGYAIRRRLETADDWVDAMDLAVHARRAVQGHAPQYGALKACGHEKGGALILQRTKPGAAPPDLPKTAPTPATARSSRLPWAIATLFAGLSLVVLLRDCNAPSSIPPEPPVIGDDRPVVPVVPADPARIAAINEAFALAYLPDDTPPGFAQSLRAEMAAISATELPEAHATLQAVDRIAAMNEPKEVLATMSSETAPGLLRAGWYRLIVLEAKLQAGDADAVRAAAQRFLSAIETLPADRQASLRDPVVAQLATLEADWQE